MALPASVASALAAVTASVPSLPLFHLLHEVKRRRCPPADDAPVLSGLFDVQVLPPLGSVPEQVAREEVKVSLFGERGEGGGGGGKRRERLLLARLAFRRRNNAWLDSVGWPGRPSETMELFLHDRAGSQGWLGMGYLSLHASRSGVYG